MVGLQKLKNNYPKIILWLSKFKKNNTPMFHISVSTHHSHFTEIRLSGTVTYSNKAVSKY